MSIANMSDTYLGPTTGEVMGQFEELVMLKSAANGFYVPPNNSFCMHCKNWESEDRSFEVTFASNNDQAILFIITSKGIQFPTEAVVSNQGIIDIINFVLVAVVNRPGRELTRDPEQMSPLSYNAHFLTRRA